MTSQKVAQPMAAVASYSTSHSEVRALDFYKTDPQQTVTDAFTLRVSLLEVGCRGKTALVKGDNFFTPTIILRKER